MNSDLISALRASAAELSLGISRLSQTREALVDAPAPAAKAGRAATLDSMKAALAACVDQTLLAYDAALSALRSRAAAAESAVRASINRTFEAMAARHTAELAQQEFDRAVAVQTHAQHAVPHARDLQALARGYARRGEVDLAIRIRGEAEAVAREERAAGLRDIGARFALLQRRTLERQGGELEALAKCLAGQLSECRARAARDARLRRRKAALAIRRHAIAAIADARRLDAADALTEFLEAKLIRERRTDLFEGDAASAADLGDAGPRP